MLEIYTKTEGMTVEEMTEMLSNAYCSLINSGKALKRFPSVMLWGPPGVGKSQGVRQVAENIGISTGKKVNVTDVRLLLFNPVDLRGIPTANRDKSLAVWLKPKIFQMDESSDIINILFLDEISAAPQSVQAAAYQITLDRRIGEHSLPDNCIVIAAGNRVTDKSVAYNMPKALANRLCHLKIESDVKSWCKWASLSGINEAVTAFISYSPSSLMGFSEFSDSELAFPTPRSWEMVSNILNDVSDNVKEVFPLIAGCIGEENAHQFLSWSEVYQKIPSVDDIFSGKAVKLSNRPDVLYALSEKIVRRIKETHSDGEIKNVIAYVAKLPYEFQTKIFSEMLKIKSIVRKLSNNGIFDNWFLRSGRRWDDYGL